MLDYESVYH